MHVINVYNNVNNNNNNNAMRRLRLLVHRLLKNALNDKYFTRYELQTLLT
jgi:hypothetical protein